MSYTQVFGGTTLYPSDVSYLTVTLTADKALEWPLESNSPDNPAARIVDVTATGAYSILLPDATLTGAGQTLLFNNLSASASSFLIKDYSGNTLATVAVGEQWQVYLASVATPAGVWRVFRYGASTATVQPSALAGYGLTVTSGTLSQSTPVTTFNTSPRTLLATDRASMFVWTGTGAGTVDLPSTALLGNNYYVSFRNSGGGDLTIDPAGSELIDGAATLTIHPGDSLSVATDGLSWYSLGLGQQAVFAFDYTSITVTGGTYTLSGSELNRIAYQFVGTLTSNSVIVVPSTIQQYWVSNQTTGPYTLSLKTSTGTPVVITQGSRGIYYCNGSNVVDADTATISLPVLPTDGGTGITSYTTGDLLYANSSSTLTKLSDIAIGNALLSGGVGAPPAYGKVGLTTHVTGTLPVSNGGTGQTSLTAGYLLKGSGTSAIASSVVYDNGVNVGIGTTSPQSNVEIRGAAAGSVFDALTISNYVNASAGTGVALYFDPNGAGSLARAASIRSVQPTSGNFADLRFFTANSDTPAERVRIDASGNVGIGTTSPSYALDVRSSVDAVTSIASTGSINSAFLRLVGRQTGTDAEWNIVSTGAGLSATALRFVKGTWTNAPAMTIDSSGNVGIGTASPGIKVEISASINDDGLLVGNTSANGGRVRLNATGTGGRNYHIASTANGSGAGGGKFVVFDNTASDAARLAIDSSGNVGIGTTSPVAKLDVNEGTSAYVDLRVRNSTAQAFLATGTSVCYAGTYSNVPFVLSTNNTERMRIDASGNVGIGTTSPVRQLVVQNASSSYIGLNTTSATSKRTGIAFAQSGTDQFEIGIDIGASNARNWYLYDNTTGGTRLFVDGNGNFGVGTIAPQARLDVTGQALAQYYGMNATGTASGVANGMYAPAGNTLGLVTNLTERVRIESTGDFRPGADNAYSNGTGSFRWSVVYAATGTINTSDEREKEWRGGPTDAELAAASAIIKEMGFYQWKHALTEKGADGARYHFGVRAQQVWRIMAEHGLVDPITDGKPGKTPYAFMCWDEWPEIVETKVVKKGRKKIKEKVVVRAAGSRFGLRVDELTMFLLTAMEARLARLEGGAL